MVRILVYWSTPQEQEEGPQTSFRSKQMPKSPDSGGTGRRGDYSSKLRDRGKGMHSKLVCDLMLYSSNVADGPRYQGLDASCDWAKQSMPPHG